MTALIKEMASRADIPLRNAPEGTELVPAMTVEGGTVAIPASALGGGGAGAPLRREIVEFSTNRTLLATDEAKALHMTAGVDITLTVPTNAATAIPVGAEFEVARIGAGGVSIAAATGVTINGQLGGSEAITGQWQTAVMRKIDTDEWLVIGAIGNPLNLPVYTWDDVFTDHSAAGGQDWTGWGDSNAQPAEPALEWFMNNVLPLEAPDGSIFDLDSPNGEIHINGRFQPPPRSVAKNITLDLTDQNIERGYDGASGRYGQFFLWGLKVNDPAMGSAAVVDVTSESGDTSLVLRDDPDTAALMSVATPGSIVEIRTNTTAPNYHPDESRATMFISSVNAATRTINFTEPLPIRVPVTNDIGSWESSDPSTVTLLQGSLLSTDVPAGSTTISMANALGLSAGDWLLVQTQEIHQAGKNQWNDGVEPNFGTSLPDHGRPVDSDVPINQEIHEIASVVGNTVTLRTALGKNKLRSFEASAVKIDPIENFTLRGGSMNGFVSGGPSAWDHQYVWTRYMINSTVRDMRFDDDLTRANGQKRVGQTVRFDTGDNNLMENCYGGSPQRVGAGEGYGMSMRLGERNSTVRNCEFLGARHSIEFWASSGGCVAEFNHTTNTTSSCIDTHGNWNTGITIRNNLIDRDAATAAASGDLGDDGEPDAIRIGNNKFIFDENIQVLNNRVIDFDGHALSIVPGVHNVTIDGLEIQGVYRVLNLMPNARHGMVVSTNIVIRNVVANGWRDKMVFINRTALPYIFDGLLLENWTLGQTLAAEIGNPYETDTNGAYISGVTNLTIRNWDVTGPVRSDGGDGRGDIIFEEVGNVVLDNVVFRDCYRGLGLQGDVQNLTGTIEFRDLTATNAELVWAQGTGTNNGNVTIRHNQPFGSGANELDLRLAAGDAINLNYQLVA